MPSKIIKHRRRSHGGAFKPSFKMPSMNALMRPTTNLNISGKLQGLKTSAAKLNVSGKLQTLKASASAANSKLSGKLQTLKNSASTSASAANSKLSEKMRGLKTSAANLNVSGKMQTLKNSASTSASVANSKLSGKLQSLKTSASAANSNLSNKLKNIKMPSNPFTKKNKAVLETTDTVLEPDAAVSTIEHVVSPTRTRYFTCACNRSNASEQYACDCQKTSTGGKHLKTRRAGRRKPKMHRD